MNMKSIYKFLLICFLAISNTILAQDIIKLKSGEDLKTKVVEIGATEIKYKKIDNLDGPTYTVTKEEVVEIKYKNGTIDDFSYFSTPTVQPTPSTVIDEEYRKKRRKEDAQQAYDLNMRLYNARIKGGVLYTSIGVPTLACGIGLTIGGAILQDQYDPGGYNGYTNIPKSGNLGAALGLLIPGLLITYTGIALTVVGAIKLGSASKYKERALNAKALLSFEPSIQPNYINTAMTNPGYNSGMSIKITF